MDDCQPVALRASARFVSIAAVDSRLVSSSVERRGLIGKPLHQTTDQRKLLAFDHFIQSSHIQWQISERDGSSWPFFTLGGIRSAWKPSGNKPLPTSLGRPGRI
jgi:hypothetical protein